MATTTNVSGALWTVGKVQRSSAMWTSVSQNTLTKYDSLRNMQTVKFSEQWTDVF